MRAPKFSLRTAGILAVLVGLIWIGQGSGYFPYPRSSFMINQIQWVYYGLILYILGLIAVSFSQRK